MRRSIVEHIGQRPNLTMDDLAEMTEWRPRLEKEMKLPGDSRGAGNRVYFFSIDGKLRGTHLKGCLLAGECGMVQERSFERAHKLAQQAIADTLEFARDYFDKTLDLSPIAAGMDPLGSEQYGRRSHAKLHAPNLETDPKLKAMIAHVLGGKPWRG